MSEKQIMKELVKADKKVKKAFAQLDHKNTKSRENLINALREMRELSNKLQMIRNKKRAQAA